MEAFLSYPREADLQDGGSIIQLCERLEREVLLQTGIVFRIRHDQKDIDWGARWSRFVAETPKTVDFLIAIITETYFTSQACRKEYEAFIELEKILNRDDRILPLYYVEVRQAEHESDLKIREWKKDIMERQYADWRPVRNLDTESTAYKSNLTNLAKKIGRILSRNAETSALKRKQSTRRAGSADERNDVTEKAGLYELIDQGNRTTLRLFDTGEEFIIDYTPIVESNLAQYGIVKDDFQELVIREVLSHRLMLRYDYEDRAIPLLSGMTVIVTKRANLLVLEWLTKPQMSPSIDEAWQQLCRAYYVATRLQYRTAHEMLLKKRTRQEAIERATELVLEANQFFVEASKLASKKMYPKLLNRKNSAEDCLREAERGTEELDAHENAVAYDLGRIIVPLEMTISNVHKLILDHSKYRKL